MKKPIVLVVAAAVLLSLTNSAALAENKNIRGGADRGGFGAEFDRFVPRKAVRGNDERKVRLPPAFVADCPPGLAKKNPPCVPPGQAKARYDNEYEGRQVWIREGARLDDYSYHLVRYPDRYRLGPLGPNERYAIIGNQVVVVDSGTGRILDLLNMVNSILD
jgi:hypothetical protein